MQNQTSAQFAAERCVQIFDREGEREFAWRGLMRVLCHRIFRVPPISHSKGSTLEILFTFREATMFFMDSVANLLQASTHKRSLYRHAGPTWCRFDKQTCEKPYQGGRGK